MELITDLRAIRKEIGLRLEETSLYPKLNLDAYKDVAPILIKEKEKKYSLLVKEVETGNFTRGGSAEPVIKKYKVRLLYYSSYFIWDKLARRREEFPPDETEALRRVFKGKELRVHADMVLDRFRRLSRGFDLTFASPPDFGDRTWVYELDKRKVEAAFLGKRRDVNRWAVQAVEGALQISPEDKATVKKFLRRPPFRSFHVLDGLMKEMGLASVLASSPINLQEMTGIPYDRIKESLLSIYTRGKVYLLSQRPLKNAGWAEGIAFKKGERIFATFREAIQTLSGNGPLGVEEKNLDIGRAMTLGLNRLQNASNLFRAWREVRSGQDLGAYILAALGTKEAMEGALHMAEKKLQDRVPVYEKDVEKKFNQLLKEFEKNKKSPLRLEPYFMVLHAGIRTPYPSLPGFFRLSEKMNSLKLDAGILAKDRGLILACSDLARSIVTNEQGKDLYALLERAMLKAAIPGGREGQTGEDVYWAGMEPLLREEKKLRERKLLPQEGLLQRDYNRDIGHTFGKQESTTLFFKKGEKGQTLQQGMVSAIEYQWPYQGYALGIEDMFVVGPKYGINITR